MRERVAIVVLIAGPVIGAILSLSHAPLWVGLIVVAVATGPLVAWALSGDSAEEPDGATKF